MYKSTNSSEPGTTSQAKPPVVNTHVAQSDGEKRGAGSATPIGKTSVSVSPSTPSDGSSRKLETSHPKHHAAPSSGRNVKHVNVLSVLKSGGNLG